MFRQGAISSTEALSKLELTVPPAVTSSIQKLRLVKAKKTPISITFSLARLVEPPVKPFCP